MSKPLCTALGIMFRFCIQPFSSLNMASYENSVGFNSAVKPVPKSWTLMPLVVLVYGKLHIASEPTKHGASP
jgi:hypothetical protein